MRRATDNGIDWRRLTLGGVLICMTLAGVACTPVAHARKVEPARLESDPGSNVKRVVMTVRAAERIGLRTAIVREESVAPTRRLGGEVVAGDPPRVRIRLASSELGAIRREADAHVFTRSSQGATPLVARPSTSSTSGVSAELWYVLERGARIAPSDRVDVVVPLTGGEARRLVVPYSAVVYDTSGATWAYAEVAPLTYRRVSIVVESIEGSLAQLSEGPPPGTAVVSVGVAELLGTELGGGK